MTGIDADVLSLARAGEPERHLAATLASESERGSLMAIAAFAADLARIPSLVKEPMMGEIRLQWWRDTIERFSEDGDASGHPIADALGDAVRRHNLPVASLMAMTEARAFDLYPDPMPDRASLDGYVTKTDGVPFALALKVLGADAATAEPLADLAARSYGLARLLADLPHRVARGGNPLPRDLIAKYGVDIEAMSAGRTSPALRALLDALADEVRATYAVARSRCRDLPADQRIALLPIATIPAYLAALVSRDRDPLREAFAMLPIARVWRMARAHWFGP